MKYVLSGATSGTGDAIIARLINKVDRDNITCLVRASSNMNLLQSYGLRTHVCDVTKPDSYASILRPDTIYVDMSGIRNSHKSLEALITAKVERAYFVSTTAVLSKYQHLSELYNRNEELIRRSGIVYTILQGLLKKASGWRYRKCALQGQSLARITRKCGQELELSDEHELP